MNYFEIKPDGQAYIRTDSGTIIRKVGNGESVNHADFNNNEEMFVITYNSGRCELRDRKNQLVRMIAEGNIAEAYFKQYASEVKRTFLSRKKEVKEYVLLVMKDGSTQSFDI
ncbi:MAG: hypothetical protein IKY27_09985 [Bacteroidales bacterium]|nr:hypothetical protein [Bacteroidales bacterium]